MSSDNILSLPFEALYALQSPCFVLDTREFDRSVEGFRDALSQCLRHPRLSISVKTITVPYMLKLARQRGCMAEVVSYDEYRLARLCGFPTEEIIYNGPLKSKETFLEAIQGGAVVNLETQRELRWLEELPKDKTYGVGLRLAINVSRTSPEDATGPNDFSRFGFSDEAGDLEAAIRHIRSLGNVRVVGVHLHKIAPSRHPRIYRGNIAYAAEVVRKYGLNLDYLDVGGGFFGIFPSKPTYMDYSETIAEALEREGLEALEVYVEPGNALLASAFAFVSTVIDVKNLDRDLVVATIDGSRNDVDPLFHKSDYIKSFIYSSDAALRPVVPHQLVGGCTCMEADRMFTLNDSPLLREGDKVVFRNVGAYTMTLSPQFIRLWPAIYSWDGNGFDLVRPPSTPECLM